MYPNIYLVTKLHKIFIDLLMLSDAKYINMYSLQYSDKLR